MAQFADLTIDDVIDNFSLFDSWEDKYTYLMDLGKKLPPLSPDAKNDANKVKGCQAEVWVRATFEPAPQGTIMRLEGDSESAIVKGLVALALLLFSEKSVVEIPGIDEKPTFESLGLDQYLSPTRKVGLNAMVKKIKGFALERA